VGSWFGNGVRRLDGAALPARYNVSRRVTDDPRGRTHRHLWLSRRRPLEFETPHAENARVGHVDQWRGGHRSRPCVLPCTPSDRDGIAGVVLAEHGREAGGAVDGMPSTSVMRSPCGGRPSRLAYPHDGRDGTPASVIAASLTPRSRDADRDVRKRGVSICLATVDRVLIGMRSIAAPAGTATRDPGVHAIFADALYSGPRSRPLQPGVHLDQPGQLLRLPRHHPTAVMAIEVGHGPCSPRAPRRHPACRPRIVADLNLQESPTWESSGRRR